MGTSSSGQYDRIDQLAEEFAARYRRGERPALSEYLERYPELADEIRGLFPALVEMEQAEVEAAPATPAAPTLQQIGDYRIVREVGRGGMGIVYEAEQLSLGRRVALKVLPLHRVRDGHGLERFQREARAAARLHHTNIVPVFDVGQEGDVSYFAMQFIQGQALDEVIAELRRLRRTGTGRTPAPAPTDAGAKAPDGPVSEAAQSLLSGRFLAQDLTADYVPPSTESLPSAGQGKAPSEASAVLPGQADRSSVHSDHWHYFRSVACIGQQVAGALAYAHQRKIIHRDIKPSNLLLDTAGVVWITDFGLAKTEEDGLTRPGDVLGTFRYMAPERFRGHCDARSDVYALGLTLYELLVLRPAFDSRDRLKLVDQVKESEPPRPRALDPRIPRDLETIVLKASAKEPGRRYATVAELADDLRRFLAGEPIRARRTGEWERLKLWCRRNPAVAGLIASLFLLVLTVAIGSLAYAWQLGVLLADSEAHRQAEVQAREDANANLWGAYLDRARAGRMSHQPGQRFASLRAIAEALKLPLPRGRSLDELRNEAIGALTLPDVEESKEWKGFPTGSALVDFDERMERYVRVDAQGTVSVCQVADEAPRSVVAGAGPSGWHGICMSPDGAFVAHRSQSNGRVRLWRVDTPKPRLIVDVSETGGQYAILCFSPDSRQLVVPQREAFLSVYDTQTGRRIARWPVGGVVVRLAYHPCSARVAVGFDHVVQIVDVPTGTVEKTFPQPDTVTGIAWHPAGDWLAISCDNARIYLVDARSGLLVREPLTGHKNHGIDVLSFSHGGDLLVSNDWSSVLRFWDPNAGHMVLDISSQNHCLRFSADDCRLAAFHRGEKLGVLGVAVGRELRTIAPPPAPVNRHVGAILHPNGRLLVSRSERGLVFIDLQSTREVGLIPASSPFGVHALGLEPGGALRTYGTDGLLRWPVREDDHDPSCLHVGPPELINAIAAEDIWGQSGDGRVVAVPQYSAGALVLHLDGSDRRVRLGPQEDVRRCAVSPDGRWVATGTHGTLGREAAKVWDAATGQLIKTFSAVSAHPAFSPDGQWLALLSPADEECQVWRVGAWTAGPRFHGQRGLVFSPDSRLIAVDNGADCIRLVATETGQEIARLSLPERHVLVPQCFTPDGSQLVVYTDETEYRVWDLRAIRRELKGMGLDWDMPDYSPAQEDPPTKRVPRAVKVDMGRLSRYPFKPGEGVAVWSLALALNAFNPEAYLLRGQAHAQLGESEAAIADYARAIALFPKDDSRRFDALLRRAANYERLQDHERALGDVEELLRDHGKARNAWRAYLALLCNNLAWECVSRLPCKCDPARLLPLAQLAVELTQDPTYINTLGVVCYRAGHYQEAVDVLRRSLALEPQYAGFDLFFLAMSHHHLGDARQARDCYNQAVRWVQDKRRSPTRELIELTQFQAEAAKLLKVAP